MKKTENMLRYNPSDLKSTLSYIHVQFGNGTFSTQGKTVALLSDLAPKLLKERNMVKILDETGILAGFLQVSSTDEAEQRRFIRIAQVQLANERFIDTTLSGAYLNIFCEVLGWGFVPCPASPLKVLQTVESRRISKPQHLKVGQEISFGYYPQTGNQLAPIHWIVLENRGGHVLMLSRDILDARAFAENCEWATWDVSALMRWLNDDFFKIAFSAGEQSQILLHTLHTPDNPLYKTYSGGETECRVSIPDVFEVTRLFANNEARVAHVSMYAFEKGSYRSVTEHAGVWRLRTAGFNQKMTAVVDLDGSVDYYGDSIFADYIGIRPLLYIRSDGSQG